LAREVGLLTSANLRIKCASTCDDLDGHSDQDWCGFALLFRLLAALIESPVATMRVLSLESATHAPGGASFKIELRSRGADSVVVGRFFDITGTPAAC